MEVVSTTLCIQQLYYANRSIHSIATALSLGAQLLVIMGTHRATYQLGLARVFRATPRLGKVYENTGIQQIA